MVRRELRIAATEKVVGYVDLPDDGDPVFDGAAGDVFAGLLRRVGPDRLRDSLIADGWSNGYLYLAPVEV